MIYRAGKNLLPHFGNAPLKEATSKQEIGAVVEVSVTKLDEQTEQFIEQELGRMYPDIGFKGEQYGEQNKHDRTWLIDPIDGTAFFARGIQGCTTMVSLIEEGKIEGRICKDGFGKDFDFAAGQLLVQEAGGVVVNIGTNSFDYRNLDYIAANKQVYEGLTQSLFPILS